MKRIVLPDIDKSKALLFILIALIFKVFFFVASMKSDGTTFDKLYFIKGDILEYVNFCENFYRTGQHFTWFDGHKEFTYRMPNFIFIYYPVRLLFNQQNTLNFIIVFQIILSAVSTYFLALLARLVFKRDIFFYATFLIYCLSSYVPKWNNFLLTESIATSLLIISVYLLFTAKRDKSVKWLILSGLLMSLAIFFRAFLGAVWAAAIVYIWFSAAPFLQRLKLVFAYAFFFLLMESMWVGRNYQKTGTLVVFDSSHFWYETLSYKSQSYLIKFIKAYGFSQIDWEKDFEGTWFLSDEQAKTNGTVRPGDDIFPQRTFNADLNIDSLKYARSNLMCANDTSVSPEIRMHCDIEARRLFEKFIVVIKTTKPVDYYIGNRVRILYRLLNQHSGSLLKSLRYPFNVLFTFMDYFINYLVIIGGLIGVFIVLFSNFRNQELYFLIFIPVFVILFFGTMLMELEARFLTTAYPFLLVICTAAIIKLVEKKYLIPLLLFSALILVLSAGAVMREIKF